jgi:hypothetical protein
MSATEQELEEVQGLAARGQQVGGSTHPDVATATLELGLKEAGGDELHGVVDGCETDLVEEIALIAPASLTIEPRPRSRTGRKAANDLTPDMSTDALQLLLTGISKLPLLSAGRRLSSPNGSSVATWARSRRWSSRTFGWSSRSRSTTATRGCRSLT